MTEDPLLTVRRDNLKTMRRELYRLKIEYQEEFDKWLAKSGEYLTATHVRWSEFRAKAIEYKELNFKVKRNEKAIE